MSCGRLKNQCGAAIVEMTVSILVVTSILVAGVSAAYISFVYVWLERATYEGLICLSTKASERACASELESSAKFALPLGKVADLHVLRTPNKATIALRFEYEKHVLLKHRDSLNLPISVGPKI
jgi:hypothetical protein